MKEIAEIEEKLKKLLIERDCINNELNATNRQLSDSIKTYIEDNIPLYSEVEIAGKSYTFKGILREIGSFNKKVLLYNYEELWVIDLRQFFWSYRRQIQNLTHQKGE